MKYSTQTFLPLLLILLTIISQPSSVKADELNAKCINYCTEARKRMGPAKICDKAVDVNPYPQMLRQCQTGLSLGFDSSCLTLCLTPSLFTPPPATLSSYPSTLYNPKGQCTEGRRHLKNNIIRWCVHGYEGAFRFVLGDIQGVYKSVIMSDEEVAARAEEERVKLEEEKAKAEEVARVEEEEEAARLELIESEKVKKALEDKRIADEAAAEKAAVLKAKEDAEAAVLKAKEDAIKGGKVRGAGAEAERFAKLAQEGGETGEAAAEA